MWFRQLLTVLWEKIFKINYGKFPASFYKISTGKAFKVRDIDANSKEKKMKVLKI